MESNNLSSEQNDSKSMKPLLVAPLGFEADLVEKLKKIFQRERPSERSYRVVYPYSEESVDILFVNYDDTQALIERNEALKNLPNATVVAASQGPLVDDEPAYHLHPYQVHGMLLTARLLSAFDKVPGKALDGEILSVSAPPVTTETEVTVANKSCCVLVVDDSVAIQKSIELNLRTLGQISEIDFADSGEMALEKIDIKQYDIIFLDVMMPGIDGYETCTRLRKKPTYKHTPVVMVSGKTSPLDEVKGIIAGCTTYLTKPVQDDAFQKLSRRMLVWMEGKKTSP